jgi:hypothetical protein
LIMIFFRKKKFCFFSITKERNRCFFYVSHCEINNDRNFEIFIFVCIP